MIIRNCVAIPCYNTPETIVSVVEAILRETKFPILIVDDGSELSVEKILKSSKNNEVKNAFKISRLHIIKHEKNLGKGEAIQNAFIWARGKGFTHLTTFDSDGQHLAREIHSLVNTVKKHPFALIIGKRKFDNNLNVPDISKFGRKFSNFWVKYQTGASVADSQSGLRIYPLLPIQDMKFYTKRYDFEIEVLIRSLWNNIPVCEVEIDVFYPSPEMRISHFRKLHDNFKISILNTILVILTLFRKTHSPLKSAAALAIGVGVGCTPFFGFHSLIIIPFALFFRLNYLLLFLGTNISIPPMIPFLTFASLFIGSFIRGLELPKSFLEVTPNILEVHFSSYLLGSFVLAFVLACITGVSIYLLLFMKCNEKKKEWNGEIRGGIGNYFLIFLLKRGGIKITYWMLKIIVPYFYVFAPKSRKSLHDYWRSLRPKLTYWQRIICILRHFELFGQIILDRIHQGFQKKKVFEMVMINHEKMLNENAPKILLGSHIGAWDISSFFLQEHYPEKKVFVVQYQPKKNGLGHYLDENLMQTSPVFLDPSKNPILDIKKAIEEKGVIGILGDRVMSSNIEILPFLGKLAIFDTNIFRISHILKTPILFVSSAKVMNQKYILHVSHEINVSQKGDIEKAVADCLLKYINYLEDYINQYPNQWLNFFPYWTQRLHEFQKSEKIKTYIFEEL